MAARVVGTATLAGWVKGVVAARGVAAMVADKEVVILARVAAARVMAVAVRAMVAAMAAAARQRGTGSDTAAEGQRMTGRDTAAAAPSLRTPAACVACLDHRRT